MAFRFLKGLTYVTSAYGIYYGAVFYTYRRKELKKPFNKYSTGEQAINNLNLNGKYAIVTGSNTGIGKETVRVLAKQGCNVIMACRSLDKANNARNDILESLKLPNNSNRVQTMRLDLSDLSSVKEFSENYKSKNFPINYLINNAGIMAVQDYKTTKNNIEMQFGVNHIGHFYLTSLLLPVIQSSETVFDGENVARKGRIINVSSLAHQRVPSKKYLVDIFDKCIVEGNFMSEDTKSLYNPWVNYGIAKASNILFSRELSKKYNANITALSLHPGGIFTDLQRHMSGQDRINIMWRLLKSPKMTADNLKSIEEGAATTLRCVSLTDDEAVNGGYYVNCDYAESKDNDRTAGAVKEERKDGELSAKLWQLSEVILKANDF